jgi:hypothetical protein
MKSSYQSDFIDRFSLKGEQFSKDYIMISWKLLLAILITFFPNAGAECCFTRTVTPAFFHDIKFVVTRISSGVLPFDFEYESLGAAMVSNDISCSTSTLNRTIKVFNCTRSYREEETDHILIDPGQDPETKFRMYVDGTECVMRDWCAMFSLDKSALPKKWNDPKMIDLGALGTYPQEVFWPVLSIFIIAVIVFFVFLWYRLRRQRSQDPEQDLSVDQRNEKVEQTDTIVLADMAKTRKLAPGTEDDDDDVPIGLKVERLKKEKRKVRSNRRPRTLADQIDRRREQGPAHVSIVTGDTVRKQRSKSNQ